MTAFSVSTQEKDLSKFALAIQGALNGRSNVAGKVTLKAATTTTSVSPTDPTNPGASTCAAQTAVLLFPTTAHAAAELAAGGCYISAVAKQTFTITHANNAQTDRTFFYVCLG